MRLCLLTSMPLSALQLMYYAQVRELKFTDVIIIGRDGEKYALFREYAAINDFRLHVVDDPNGQACIDLVKGMAPDILYLLTTSIIKKPLLDIPRLGTLNTHAGFLPRYRGRDPALWALLEGGPVGVTVHFVDESIDTGAIIAQQELKLLPRDTMPSILARNHYLHKWQTAVEALLKVREGNGSFKPQEPAQGRYYFPMHPKLLDIVKLKLAQR